MDTIQQSIKCKKHQLKDIEFIQVNEVLSEPEDKNIFYCSQCIDNDNQFKGINYVLIESIIQKGSSNILLKWPPVNNNQVLQNLIDLASDQNDQFDFIKQITDYFTSLKDELIIQLDDIQKKMIIKANDYQFNKEIIIKKYQEITSILELRELLQNNNNLDTSSLEKFRSFIAKKESEKRENTELLQNLINQIKTRQKKISFELPNIIKEQIFLLANQISFFEEENQTQQKLNQTSQSIIENKQQNVDQLMKLISNKSNFCSTEFLDSIKKDLNKLSFLIQTTTFSSMFQINKKPIKFDKINDENLQLINEYVDHQIELVSNQQYKSQIEQSNFNILNLKLLNESFIKQIKKYLVDTNPFLKQVSNNNFISDQNPSSLFQKLPDETISILSEIISKGIEVLNENKILIFNFLGSNSMRYQQRTIVNQIDKQEIEISLNKTGQHTDILQGCFLKKNQKYIYRFQVQNNNQQYIIIGLVSKGFEKSQDGYNQYLSCSLVNQNGYLIKNSNFGIDKQIKGGDFKVQQNNILEMRVDLSNQILEISDFPNYQFVQGLQDQYKCKLTQYEDLSFYIGIQDSTKIILNPNSLSQENNIAFNRALSECGNLISLKIIQNSNYLGDQGVIDLGNAIAKCQHLQNLYLSLSQNNIGDQGLLDLTSALIQCHNLQILKINLKQNVISSNDVSSLGSAIANFQNLRQLSIDYSLNKIGQHGISLLTSGLKNCPSLINLELILVGNGINVEGITNLGQSLLECQNLNSLKLNLQSNHIKEQGAFILGQYLANCKNLSDLYLDLFLNRLGTNGSASLIQNLSKSDSLLKLQLLLDSNKIDAENSQAIGIAFSGFTKLQYLKLQLENNQLSDKGASNLCYYLNNCPNLQTLSLDLYSNLISSDGAYNLMSSLQNIFKLRNLDIDFSGNISMIVNQISDQKVEKYLACT
ncbi:hypothetical protein ABPG73_017012 [Tetrahymena malaccensis]